MQTWIALLRSINVGGKNILPMKDLTAIMQSVGCQNVRTYIQSGNVVFSSAGKTPNPIARKIQAGVKERFGFEPHVMLLSLAELQAAYDDNPFTDAATDPKSLHFFFLESPAVVAKTDAIEDAKSTSESYALTDQVF